MLLLSEKLSHVPIMSLQTGSRLAYTDTPIIDPADLSIVALYVRGQNADKVATILFTDDIRESGELGYIVDDSNTLMTLDGLVRLQKIIDENFNLIGLPVVDKIGNKLGKVSDYSYNPLDYRIYQLIIKSSFIKSLMEDSRIIYRNQILDVSSQRIVVESAEIQTKNNASRRSDNFVNPFRAQSPTTESTNTH